MECHQFIFTLQKCTISIFWCFWVVEFLPKILKKVKWKFISKWPRGSLKRCFLRPLSNRIVKIIYNSYCISNHEGWKCPTTPTGNALLSSLENKELEWVREDCCWKCNDDNDYHIAGGVEDTSIRGFFVWSSLFENCLHLPCFFTPGLCI